LDDFRMKVKLVEKVQFAGVGEVRGELGERVSLNSMTSGAFLARDSRSAIQSLFRGKVEKWVQSVDSSSAI
jgi:hypothetical protein